MGICSRRHFLLTICTLQLLTTIERQVFDFLGFMWAPILFNFFNIIFVILGFFGAFQYRPKYIISYCIWDTLWLGWNIFCICFYLEAGSLRIDKHDEYLNLGTGSFSWWQVNGPGCKPIFDITEPDLLRPSRPKEVTGCLLKYEVIEVLHASTQCLLAFMAIVGGICLSRAFLEEDDSSRINKRKKQTRPLYSIEYSQPEPPPQDEVSPKPMTPRRVKRRSVISRDGTRRSSNRRTSVRNSTTRRKNPVNRIMEQQESLYANTIPSPLTNQNVNSLSQGTLNYDRIATAWDRERQWQPEAVNMAVSSPTLWTPDPNYSNITNLASSSGVSGQTCWDSNAASSTRQLTDSWQPEPGCSNNMQWQGQSNPTFQQTSIQSLNNADDHDDLYSNRPASARSSYSNYHGIRATPQVPNRTDIVRQSQRQFVLSGPPAYQDTVI